MLINEFDLCLQQDKDGILVVAFESFDFGQKSKLKF